jgi:arginyl-tRNA synthetase
MYTIRDAKQYVLQALKNAVGKGFTPTVDDLETPPDEKMGDIAFPCFALAKSMKRNPNEIATEIAAKIAPKEYISDVSAKGPYVNMKWNTDKFGQEILENIDEQGAKYGQATSGEGKRVMVEYAQPNTHKAIHVGHLRNFTVGQMTVNMLEANGFEVVPVSYINDLGMHVAMCLWGIKQFHNGELPKDEEDKIGFLADMYVKATEAVGDDKQKREEVSEIHRNLEKKQGDYLKHWKTTRKWSLNYIRDVFKELSLPIEAWYYESELIKRARSIIEDLIEEGIAAHSEGAWIVNLEDEDLGVNLLVKSDGTLLYNAKDIALALQKEDDYQPQRSVYVIDARQSLAMKQLFATLEKMGFQKDLTHLSYEFVTLKEGAMSSRKGNVIRYEDFRDKLVALAVEETSQRHEGWSDSEVQDVAKRIASAAMRFDMLKQDLDKKIVFDFEEALSFDGFTGPYLLYTYARIQSLLDKADIDPSTDNFSTTHDAEHRLVTVLAEYPDVVFDCGSTLRMSMLPHYLFRLAKAFAEFYEQAPVLQAEDESVTRSRLALAKAVSRVLENGFEIMGIEPVDKM